MSFQLSQEALQTLHRDIQNFEQARRAQQAQQARRAQLRRLFPDPDLQLIKYIEPQITRQQLAQRGYTDILDVYITKCAELLNRQDFFSDRLTVEDILNQFLEKIHRIRIDTRGLLWKWNLGRDKKIQIIRQANPLLQKVHTRTITKDDIVTFLQKVHTGQKIGRVKQDSPDQQYRDFRRLAKDLFEQLVQRIISELKHYHDLSRTLRRGRKTSRAGQIVDRAHVLQTFPPPPVHPPYILPPPPTHTPR